MQKIKENFSLKEYNTFHINVKTKYFLFIHTVNDIEKYLQSPIAEVTPRLILGGGSNLLFTKNFKGIILHPVIKGIDRDRLF